MVLVQKELKNAYIGEYKNLPDISTFTLKSTASFTRTLKWFNQDGTKIFGLGTVFWSSYYYQYPLTNGYDISTIWTWVQWKSFIELADDWLHTITSISSNNISYWELSTAWDAQSTLTNLWTLQVTTVLSSSYTITPTINKEWTYMYLIEHGTNSGGDYIHIFKLNTPYDVSTASYIWHTSNIYNIAHYTINTSVDSDWTCIYFCASEWVVGIELNISSSPTVESSKILAVTWFNWVSYDNGSLYLSNWSNIYQYN